MTKLAERLVAKYYQDAPHPYRLFEQRIDRVVGDRGVSALLDAGCSRTVPVPHKFLGRVERLTGIELVPFPDAPPGIETHNADLASLPVPESSVDLIISRSVFEHLSDPQAVYCEFARVLRPGGCVVFLTANMWDCGTMIARLVPNQFHAKVVRLTEGREEEDTFPTEYKTNTRTECAAPSS